MYSLVVALWGGQSETGCREIVYSYTFYLLSEQLDKGSRISSGI